MTDTISHNGSHDVHEQKPDPIDIGDDVEAAVRMHEQRRARHEKRRKELTAEIERLQDERAIEVAQVARYNRLIAIERGEVNVRGRKKNAASKGKGR